MTATAGVGPDLAISARGLLAEFNAAGVLTAADVHVAQRLGRLGGETDDRVLLAVALAVRGVRAGSVCVALDAVRELAPADAADESASARVPHGTGTDAGTHTDPDSGQAHDGVPPLPWPEPAAWGAAIERSPVVAVGADGPADRPVRWVGGRVYLDRYWRDEQVVRREVDARIAAEPFAVDGTTLLAVVRRHFPDPAPEARGAEGRGAQGPAAGRAPERAEPGAGDDRQRLAASVAALSRLTVLTGGPGTGKTTTIARLIAALQEVSDRPLRVALAAPTGKAAARLQESVRDVVAGMDAADRERVGTPTATTIHRLLGWRPGSSTRFRHDADHRLPHDLVVVDETSMVSLPLMARLLEALRPQARLVLVGDPDQLASVEAGAVLGDLVRRPPVTDVLSGRLRAVLGADAPGEAADRGHGADAADRADGASQASPAGQAVGTNPAGPVDRAVGTDPADAADQAALRNGVVRLTRTYRYGADLARLAEAIRQGDGGATLTELRRGSDAVRFVETGDRPTDADVSAVRADVVTTGVALIAAAVAGDAARALGELEGHRLLVAHRRGPAGVGHWSALAQSWVAAAVEADLTGPWPPGLPVLVTTNDRDTGLYNGDTGVVVADGAGGRVVAFGDPRDPHLVRPHRLPAVQPVHAMTIHRGQGSQFHRVSVVLPPQTSPLLTRELLYTAVTRARSLVRVVGSEAAVRAAVLRPVRRASGLQEPA